ncbi:MAG: phosphatase PAP2 family protein, partial [Candidatus Binatia bacterium]
MRIAKPISWPLGVGLLFLSFSFWTDTSVQFFLQPLRTEWGTRVMDGISYYGRGWSLTFLGALLFLLGFLVRKKKWMDAGLLSLDALLISSLVVQLVKHLTGRPRPRLLEHAFTFHGPYLRAGMEGFDSFPSGHAVTTFAIAAILARGYPRARYFLYGAATVVSFSRIYLGAHYLSDVVAGALLGILCGRLIMLYAGRLLELAQRTSQELLIGGALVILTAILFFHQLGAIPLFDVDEAVFAESTREMLETGDFLTPAYNSTPRFDKPILFYWLMSSAFALLGVNELAARFWPALAGCGLVGITFLFARAIAGLRCALLSALILTTSLGMMVLSRLAITDMVLTFFLTASVYGFYLALHDYTGPRSVSWASLGWVAAALAVLTKGPIGILFPAAIVALFIWLSGHSQQWSSLRIRTGMAVLCLILLPWYVAEAYVTEGEFLRVFFVKHNVLRYLSVNSGHKGPWFYYLVVILIGFLPWSAFLPAALGAAWKYRSQATGGNRERSLPFFLLLWAAVVLVFFSLAQTKLPNYVAPLLPVLSLLVGWWCDLFLLNEPGRSARFSAIGGGLISFILAAP